MGYATTRVMERVAAAMDRVEKAPIVFAAAHDIPQGGLLLAVPALLAAGLLRHSLEMYALPRGYYGLSSILLLPGYESLAMALTQIVSRSRGIRSLRLRGARGSSCNT